MRRLATFVGTLAVSLAVTGTAFADGTPTASGVEVGARLGYGIPLGSVAGDNGTGQSTSLSDEVSGKIPIWLDAGYRINPQFYVGAFFSYAFVSLASAISNECSAGNISCSAHELQYGVMGAYHIMPDQTIDPWVGLGIGYESVSVSFGNFGSGSTSGLQFANIQGGADYKLAPNFGVGPFLSFSLGQYSSTSAPGANGQIVSGDVQNKAFHEWLVFGVRGVYDINL